MDRKSIIILVVCFLLLFSWPLLVNKIFPPKPLPPGYTNTPPRPLAATNTAVPGTSAPPSLAEAPLPAQPVANTNAPEQLVEITNAVAHYTFSSHGGGLKLIELLKYPET